MLKFLTFYPNIYKKIHTKKITKSLSYFLFFSIPSLIVTFFLLEAFARIFLPVSDAPDIYFDQNLGNIFVPNQEGIYIKGKRSEIMGKFKINNMGWNSPLNYIYEKPKNKIRIAVIGDSYIEALQVDFNKSYPYILEDLLNNKNSYKSKFQVYTFGHSGANLFHYQNIFSDVVKKYSPDIVIINIVLNDFGESFYGLSRQDNWSLIYEDARFKSVPPKKVSNLSFKKFLRHSAIIRYLTINLDLINTSPIFNKLFYAETRNYSKYALSQIDNKTVSSMIRFVLDNINKESKQNNIRTILVIDTDKEKVYENSYAFKKFYVFETEKIAKQLGMNILNLKEVYEMDWKKNYNRFNFEFDEHWNEYGHDIIAKALFNFLNKNNLFSNGLENN